MATLPDASQIALRDKEMVNLDRLFLFDRSRKPVIIAHRGFANQGPQNTLAAYSVAVRRGATALECDVQPSADGVLYCFHDDTVDALTNGTGTFTALNSSYIDTLEFDEMVNSAISDVRISRFDEVLKFIVEHGVELHAEIKNYRTTADITLFVNAVVAAGAEDLVTVNSVFLADLQAVRALNQTLPLALIGSAMDAVSYQSVADSLHKLGRSTMTWAFASLLAVPAIVTYARSKGLDVVAWTVDNPENLRRLMNIGVRKVISNVALRGA